MDRDEVEAVIVEMLADVLGRDTEELRHEMEGSGKQMPIDSLDAVEIIVQLEKDYGVQLDDREAGAAMRSVSGLAQHIVEVRARQEKRRRGA